MTFWLWLIIGLVLGVVALVGGFLWLAGEKTSEVD